MAAAIIGLINDSLRFGWMGVSHAVIPGHANGSREARPDDRLRMNPEPRDSGFALARAPE
jgi:hypothetical protein